MPHGPTVAAQARDVVFRVGGCRTSRSDGGSDSGDAALWRTARTLLDLGEPMARWLEGVITYQPGHGGDGHGPETDPLVAVLAAVNRVGYVTTFSQPGEIVGDWYQRAAVDGFCDEATATRIYDGVLETDVPLQTNGVRKPAGQTVVGLQRLTAPPTRLTATGGLQTVQ